MSLESMVESFNELMSYHEGLFDLFERHQEALLLFDLPLAIRLLEEFQRDMARHIAAEEAVILPVYGNRAGPVPGGTLEIFLAEHRKMKQVIESLLDEARQLQPVPRPMIAFLDREFTFKHLMSHHDKREENLLYRWMDRITTPDERRVLIRRFLEMNGPIPHPCPADSGTPSPSV